ncbi:MAG: AbrB family transcriptional regulator [Jhaorihella sp.]
MQRKVNPPDLTDTARALAIGALGAALAWALAFPAAVLIGPAILVSLAGLRGMRLSIADPVRDVCFVVLGIGIGSGFTAEAGGAILRWPLAFTMLLAMLALTLWLGRTVLESGFGFDRRSAVLAAAPGHLSFVIGLAADTGSDIARIAVVQSIRLLALSVTVPFVALALGYRMRVEMLPPGPPAAASHVIVLAGLGVLLGLALRRLSVPAPLLLGPLAVSAAGQVSGLTPGVLPAWLTVPAFGVMGCMIGARFTGMTLAQFRGSLLAGLAVTAIAVAMAVLAALPVALALAMPAAHVVVAFAPGGLETMVALGAAMGASPGFVAASHILRLLVLTVLIPLSLGRVSRPG